MIDRRRGAMVLVVVLAIVATGRALSNGFVSDDVPIVVNNPLVHRLSPPWLYAQQSYWPPWHGADAYRPWTIWLLSIQYALAGPTPWAFHLLNSLLIVALTLVTFGLLIELAPLGAALGGVAIFAVHPVHVEATANVVGQGELWMGLFVVAATYVYVRARRRGSLGPGTVALIAFLYLLAAAAKEQGIVLPGILLAFELLRPPGTPSIALAAWYRHTACSSLLECCSFSRAWPCSATWVAG